jgi:uncharacterized protein (TIGR03435 family)
MPRIVLSAIFFLALSFAPSPAAQSEGPRFEVVAIKPIPRPTPGDGTPYGLSVSGARVQISFRLIDLVTRAFRVEFAQVDAPDFARDEFFDIQAALPAGATPEQVPEMLQAMLAQRFKLAYHRETREYQVDVLTVGKSGMKLPRLPDGTQASYREARLPDGSTRETRTGKVFSWFPVMNSFGGLHLVDETGLDGIYTWVRDQPPMTPGMSYQDTEQEGFKAMIEAAGLKLETRRFPRRPSWLTTWKRSRRRTDVKTLR